MVTAASKPAAHWLETDDIHDMHPRFVIGAIKKVVEPVGEAWPDNKIYNELGKRLAPKYWFSDVEKMLDYQLRKANISWKEFCRWVIQKVPSWFGYIRLGPRYSMMGSTSTSSRFPACIAWMRPASEPAPALPFIKIARPV
jgi:anaerobic selenocysteine-containing dehydrogenase